MLYAFDFNYAGIVIDAAQDTECNIWISTPTIEKLLELGQHHTGRLLGSDSFKDATSKVSGLDNFSKKDKSTKYNTQNLC